jgi:hypothetical protein
MDGDGVERVQEGGRHHQQRAIAEERGRRGRFTARADGICTRAVLWVTAGLVCLWPGGKKKGWDQKKPEAAVRSQGRGNAKTSRLAAETERGNN